MNDFFAQALSPILSDALTAIVIAAIGYFSVVAKTWLKSKMTKEQYDAASKMALGIWIELKKNYPNLTGEIKAEKMADILNKHFPLLSIEQLTAINKEIHERAKWLFEDETTEATEEVAQ